MRLPSSHVAVYSSHTLVGGWQFPLGMSTTPNVNLTLGLKPKGRQIEGASKMEVGSNCGTFKSRILIIAQKKA
jgi:hypothetical protein